MKFDGAVTLLKNHETSKMEARQFVKDRSDVVLDVNRVVKEANRKGEEEKCENCALKGHETNSKNCPALNERCNYCEKKGHYARCCRQRRNKRKYETNRNTSSKRRKYTFNNVGYDSEGDGKKYNIGNISICNVNNDGSKAILYVGDVPIQMLIDSGCEKNIIDDRTWRAMKAQGVKIDRKVEKHGIKFYGYGNAGLENLVTFEARINTSEGRELMETFYVINDGMQPLLGKRTSEKLGILKIDLPPHDGIVPVNNLECTKIDPFPKIKGIVIHIPVRDDVKPVKQPLRRVPNPLIRQFESKLGELLKTGIIERVDKPTAWISALVPVIKNEGDLRLCVDLRCLNQAIKREHYPLPVFDTIFPTLTKAKFFTVLDIRQAYHQLELDEESKDLTTFMTQYGRFRYTRLPFGINCAPEIFQRTMEGILSHCANTIVFIDDILIYAVTELKHDEYVQEVLKTLKRQNVLLNAAKCRIKMRQVKFLGHVLNGEGIRPSEDKIIAIKKFRTPETKEEIRSFLGIVTFVARFIPDLATKTNSLRQLIKKDVKFEWALIHEEAFQSIKKAMSNVETLAYFDPKDKTRLVTDASPYGLGAVLIQMKDHTERIIAYGAKSLTDTEKRYCTTEKEALAIVWGVEKFRMYLLGLEFELETDHRALESIFRPSSKPPARIERWVLRLQTYQFVVKYRKGSDNIADPLSRLSYDSPKPFDEESDTFVNMIMTSAAIDMNELELAAENDQIMKMLKEAIDSKNFDKTELSSYKFVREQLSYSGNIIIRQNQVVIPQSLRERMLILAHEGHPGESLMKRRLRSKCWWPKIDEDVTKFVKKCVDCIIVSGPSRPEPMKRREFPLGPWIDIAIDFLGPLPTGEYVLVIVDYYSRYLEMEIMKKITTTATIGRLERIFTRLGFPVTITLDNAKQFVSTEFEEWCRNRGMHLNHTSPYWPQANGQVERQNRTILKRLQIGHSKTGNWKSEINNFLMMYLSTPHTVTGKTPSELMMGKTIRTKIPQLVDLETALNRDEIAERDLRLKEKGKETMDKERRAMESDIRVGDRVVMWNNMKENKLIPNYKREVFVVMKRKGSNVCIRSEGSRNEYERNVSQLKKMPVLDNELAKEDMASDEEPEFYGFEENLLEDESIGESIVQPPAKKKRERCGNQNDDYLYY